MREKNNLKSFTGKKVRRNPLSSRLGQLMDSRPRSPDTSDDSVQGKDGADSQRHGESLLRQQELLHHEIKHGKEYLQRVEDELNKSRASLEQWNRYELISSAHPLDHLIETMSLQEKTRQFLVGWLERQERKLAKIRADIESRPGWCTTRK